MAFENIVQPFESFDVTYPRRIIKADTEVPENVVLKVGADGGSIKTLGYSRNYSLTTYMKKIHREKIKQQKAEETDGAGNKLYPDSVEPGRGPPIGGLSTPKFPALP